MTEQLIENPAFNEKLIPADWIRVTEGDALEGDMILIAEPKPQFMPWCSRDGVNFATKRSGTIRVNDELVPFKTVLIREVLSVKSIFLLKIKAKLPNFIEVREVTEGTTAKDTILFELRLNAQGYLSHDVFRPLPALIDAIQSVGSDTFKATVSFNNVKTMFWVIVKED